MSRRLDVFKIFILAPKAYKVESLIQPVQVPLPRIGHQLPLQEASDHSGSLVGVPPLTQRGLGTSHLRFPCRQAGGTSGPRARPRWGGERVLGSEGSLAQRRCRRVAEELSVSYSFVYFTCSLTVSFKVIYVAEALLYFNHMVIVLFC